MKNKANGQIPGSPAAVNKLNERIKKLLGNAAKAAAAPEMEKAVKLYTQALSMVQEESPSQNPAIFEILQERAACFHRLGDVNSEISDLEAMLLMAKQTNDLVKQVTTLNTLQYAYVGQGNVEKARKAAEEAVALARRSGDRKLEADSLNALVDTLNRQGFVRRNER